ncbi:Hypothetical protein A7982_10223 [Minicystis rosea]|nr:Hypothetical protein A7982_10223 [Minicystis rosea]
MLAEERCKRESGWHGFGALHDCFCMRCAAEHVNQPSELTRCDVSRGRRDIAGSRGEPPHGARPRAKAPAPSPENRRSAPPKGSSRPPPTLLEHGSRGQVASALRRRIAPPRRTELRNRRAPNHRRSTRGRSQGTCARGARDARRLTPLGRVSRRG